MPNKKRKDKQNEEGCTECGCGSFLTEFAEEFTDYGSYRSFENNGVRLKDDAGMLRVSYDGLLAKSGAEHIYAAVSYGDNTRWNHTSYLRMDKNGQNKFEAILPISGNRQINIAFKDCANNWDNNSAYNYSFIAH
ncbi:MAG: carbohydrate-binding protein [Clostridia bacterium]|nr:carbohydrate-binding protein [Clostridia bacterium]